VPELTYPAQPGRGFFSQKRTQEIVSALIFFTVFFAGMAFVQFATPDMPDNDGYYHIKLAYLMRTEGLRPDFTYLPISILNPREFYDHHFLFHLELIPFTFGDLRLGAKWVAATNASLAFLAIWWLLRGQKVPWAALWALGLLAVSEAFLYRMSITRAQSLSLGILALSLHWMFTRRYKLLLPLGFVYVWTYNAFPLLGALAVLYTLAVLISERRLELHPILYAGLGTGLGLVINLYFPYNLIFIFRHLLPKLTEATAISVGNEWFPYRTNTLLENSLLALVAFGAGVVALGLHERRMEARTAASLFAALLFGVMLFQARRFVEYFPPFALIFAALAWTPLLENLTNRRAGERLPRRWLQPHLLSAAILTVILIVGATITLRQAQDSLRDSRDYRTFAAASQWLEANTPAGERIFQTDWDDFPRLFFYNTHNTYLIGLDPTYLQLFDAELYDEWVQITQGEVANPARAIRTRFGCNYALSDLAHEEFLFQAENDPGMQEVYRDEHAVIYQVNPAP
jgi:hypothetical protein